MSVYTLFELFLLAVSFYGIFRLEGSSQYLVPLACLFCLFWVDRLERKRREDEEARKRLLQYRLEKHREETIRRKAEAAPSSAPAEEVPARTEAAANPGGVPAPDAGIPEGPETRRPGPDPSP